MSVDVWILLRLRGSEQGRSLRLAVGPPAAAGLRLELSPGVGLTMNADDRYRLMSETGAIILVVEAERLEATDAGKSTPERVWGALWPGEVIVRRRRTLLSVMRWICFRMRWWPMYRRITSVGVSGWLAEIAEEREAARLRAGRGR